MCIRDSYYRGDWRRHPRTAGRSSQLFNTGTASWLYRCLIEGLFGLRGEGNALRIAPQLPSHWREASVVRHFRGARIELQVQRIAGLGAAQVKVDDELLLEPLLRDVAAGMAYRCLLYTSRCV